MRIVCSSCQQSNALPDGPKTPTGKAICHSCKDKIEKYKASKNKRNTAATSTLKNHPDRYADSLIKQSKE